MTEELTAETEHPPPIRVSLQGVRWVIDYGGGITRRLTDRDEVVALAQSAAAAEGRDVDLAA